ncbi:protein of unknown function [Candidatus Methylomirabilis oxygeniifera]|uniref:Uncharacterized protein n=1 Tax=Methylomirabilis oxygeniifera TaxID=671143 RepID=D5MJY5_METO1|nr:protein of unknown function [Candidatus Methylomirabilis oxyfera]
MAGTPVRRAVNPWHCAARPTHLRSQHVLSEYFLKNRRTFRITACLSNSSCGANLSVVCRVPY